MATLGTLYVFRGVTYAVVHGGQINASNLPPAFLGFATGSVLGIPNLVLLVLVVMLGFGIYLGSYRGGREYYALGSNAEAAVLAGINVKRRTMIGFMLSGAIAGLAGVLYLARFGTVDATAGTGPGTPGHRGGGGGRRQHQRRRGHPVRRGRRRRCCWA